MAQIALFDYLPGDSIIHTFDPRLKIGSVFILCIAAFLSPPTGLPVIAFLLGCLISVARIPLGYVVRRFRFFFILGAIILLANTLTSPDGYPIHPRIPFGTWQGLYQGVLGAARLLLFVAAGVLLLSTTTIIQLRDALTRIFRYVPGIPEQKVATMISLTMTFVPTLLRKAREIRETGQSRCISQVKNPVRRIVFFTYPLLRNVFVHAHTIAEAMESRGYKGERTLVPMRMKKLDAVLVTIILIGCALALFSDRIIGM